MRNGYKVYDSDTHVGPSADTLEKYLSSRVRELVPDLESRKVPQRRHSARLAYASPYRTRFRLGSGGAVGGWGADVPRTLGEAEPRAATGGASGRLARLRTSSAMTGTSTDASVTWTRRGLTSSSLSTMAGRAGTRTVRAMSRSCGRNIAFLATSAANTRIGSSR